MTRPQTKTIPGYRVQAMLPVSIGTLGAVCEEADFTEYPDTGPCVEALVRLRLLKTPYTLVVSIQQAVDADIIERVEKESTMNEEGFTNCLKAVLDGELEVNESFDPDGVRNVETFEEAGIMTRNHGLVVRMDDRSEYQITIVKSR